MGRKYQSILETVGNTPVVRINRLAPAGINLFGRSAQDGIHVAAIIEHRL